MSRPIEFTGRLWLITGPSGDLIDNIDTDMIFHNAHLAITDLSQMGRFAFGNLKGWEHFAKEAQPGDIVVVGKNFGAGSSRQQAVDCFASLKIKAIVAESYGAIYKRNAINSGFPIITCPGINLAMKQGYVCHHDSAALNLGDGAIRNASTRELIITAESIPKVQMDIYLAGDMFAYGRLFEPSGE